jgi:MFS family permease
MLDRYGATIVSMSILFLAAMGIVILWLTGLKLSLLAVILLGLAAGAEIDLLAYLTAQIFGRRAYGAIYGWQYSVFALGYGFSPFLVGHLRDYFGSYDIAFLASAVSMLLSAGSAIMIGRLRNRELLQSA